MQIDCLGSLRINYATGHNYGQTGKQDRNILKLRTACVGSTRSNEVVLRILLFLGLVEATSILLLPSVEYCSLVLIFVPVTDLYFLYSYNRYRYTRRI